MEVEEEQEEEGEMMMMKVVGEMYCGLVERQLTVRKTSVFYPGDGFAAYEQSSGDLVFRMETYGRGPSLSGGHLVLMDSSGASILTLRRKWPSLHQRWEGYLGDRMEGQKPLFTVKRPFIFGGERAGLSVEVHDGEKEYRVEGSFAQRCCRVVYLKDEEAEEEVVAAEIKRKVDEHAHVVLGRDVFCLHVRPQFDSAFAMGLVLILDQISSSDDSPPHDHLHQLDAAVDDHHDLALSHAPR